MSTTHPINRTTEWYDLQVKYGNYDPLAPEVKSEEVSRKAQELFQTIDPLEERTLQELESAEDAVEEDVIAKYRQRRLEELKAKQRLQKFGEVVEITAHEYIDEVTNASKGNDGQQIVVCLLYKDGIKDSVLLRHFIKEIAAVHKEVKFCQGVSDKVIPNFQDSAVPALVIYRGGRCEKQVFGTSLFGGPRMSRDSVEWVLAKKCKIMSTDLRENPLTADETSRGSKGTVLRWGQDSDEEEDQEDRAEARHTVAQDRGFSDQGVEQTVSLMRKLL